MLDLSNSSEVFAFSTYALQLQDVDPNHFHGQNISVNLRVEDFEDMPNDELNNPITFGTVFKLLENTSAAVQLPESVVEGCRQTSDVLRLSFTVFLSDILFQSQNSNRSDIKSLIMSTRLRCAVSSPMQLLNPISAIFRTTQNVSLLQMKLK